MALPIHPASASTAWYVSASGSDVPGCGSSASPCQSITYVLTAVPGFADGDTINVSGLLSENVSLDRSVVITGQTSDAAIQAASAGSVLSVSAGVSVTLNGLTIKNGNAFDGGGIRNQGTLVATNVVITGNSASNSGGGIYNAGTITVTNGRIIHNQVAHSGVGGGGIENGGALFLSDTIIEHNKGATYGGGIDNFGGQVRLVRVVVRKNEAAAGAGIANDNGATLEAEASAIVQNAASNQGGGISNTSFVVLRNVTLSGNSLAAGPGAGLHNEGSASSASLSFVSIISNTSNPSHFGASGVSADAGSQVAMTATVIAYNTARNCRTDGGTFQSFNYNVSSDAQCNFLIQPQDASNVDPRLTPLKFDGSTYTHGPMQGSVLLDVVELSSCLPADQRGVARPQGTKCDVGAHEATPAELNSADLEITGAVPTSVPRASNFVLRLRVKNFGPNAAQAPIVTTTLPNDVQFVGASGDEWSCGLAGAVLTCSYQSAHLNVGEASDITVSLKAPQTEMVLVATAVVSTLTADPDLNNNTITATSSVIITNTRVYVPIVSR